MNTEEIELNDERYFHCGTTVAYDNIKIFIGQIPKTYEEGDLKRLLSKYGEITSVKIFLGNSLHESGDANTSR